MDVLYEMLSYMMDEDEKQIWKESYSLRDGICYLTDYSEDELEQLDSEMLIPITLAYQLQNMHIRLCSKDAILLRNHQERFLIDKIYEHHKREAQETIIRLATNDYYYRKQLGKSLSSLFPEGVESPERFYWGHEMDEKNVHERPLNKLVQDIVNNYQ